MKLILSWLFFFSLTSFLFAGEKELLLRENLQRAQVGDFIVTAQNKNYTLLLVRNKTETTLAFEEITLPMERIPKNSVFSWRSWAENGGPGNTSWVTYTVNLHNGEMLNAFSFTKNEWYLINQSHNILSTLLNLPLQYVPENERKKVGTAPHSGRRQLWQPRLVVDGNIIQGVGFSAWKARWPKDGSELSNKLVEIYIPTENDKFPSYFPYWLQISGMIGKAKIHIVDSGSKLTRK